MSAIINRFYINKIYTFIIFDSEIMLTLLICLMSEFSINSFIYSSFVHQQLNYIMIIYLHTTYAICIFCQCMFWISNILIFKSYNNSREVFRRFLEICWNWFLIWMLRHRPLIIIQTYCDRPFYKIIFYCCPLISNKYSQHAYINQCCAFPIIRLSNALETRV